MNVRVGIVVSAAITLIMSLLLIIAIATPIHRILFSVIPPDGSVTIADRTKLDSNVVAYLITGSSTVLSEFSPTEQQHMSDVRIRLMGVVAICMLGLTMVAIKKPTHREWHVASTGALVIFVVTIVAFEPLFILMHELLFSGGNWYLPADQFILTQVYPVNFFVACWAIIALSSWGLLFALGRQKAVR